MSRVASCTSATKPAASVAVGSIQSSDEEVFATMSRSSSTTVGAISRQNLRQEPYAVMLQVRICARGGR